MNTLRRRIQSGRFSGRKHIMKSIRWLLAASVVLLAAKSFTASTSQGQAGPGGTCCYRDLSTLPVPMPAGGERDLGYWFAGAVDSALVGPSAHTKCPNITFRDAEWAPELQEIIEKMIKAARKENGWPAVPEEHVDFVKTLDYVFTGTLSAQQVTGKTPVSYEDGYESGTKTKIGGDLIGTFEFKLTLDDRWHGEVVKEASRAWTGCILEGLGFWRDDGTHEYMIQELAKQFLPLEKLIRNYERIPETCQVEVPEDKVRAGQTVTIRLTDFVDSEGRQTQWWQHVLVKANKGKILNGEAAAFSEEPYRVFKVGREGVVNVEYQAPSECKDVTETLTVCNTCEMKESRGTNVVKYPAEREIAKKTFDIDGNCWNVNYTFTEQMNVTSPQLKASRQYSLKVRGRVYFKERKRNDEIYESDSAVIELNDSFNQHITETNYQAPDTHLHGYWTATKNGQVPMRMRLVFNTHSHKYSLFVPAWHGDPVIVKGTYQWNGVPREPDGAREFTCQTVLEELPIEGLLSPDNDAAGDIAPRSEPYQEGQSVLSGEYPNVRSIAWSVGCVCCSGNLIMSLPSMPVGAGLGAGIALNPFNASLTIPSKPWTKSVKWEIRKGK